MKLRNYTESDELPLSHGRWYGDACGGAFALELLGERWSALIVRELAFGGRRFSDIRAGLPAISAKALTGRLAGLEAAGIVYRRQLPPPASARVYELTEWGRAADEPLLALCRWALRSPRHDPTLFLSPAAMMMSLRALFRADRAGSLELEGAVRVGMDGFRVAVVGGTLSVMRGEPDESTRFVIAAPDTVALRRLFYGKHPVAELAPRGLEISGETAAATAFVSLFALPEKVG